MLRCLEAARHCCLPNLPSKVEIYNDLDGDVVAFFRVLRDKSTRQEFHEKCHYTPFSTKVYSEYRKTWHEQTDLVERLRGVSIECMIGLKS